MSVTYGVLSLFCGLGGKTLGFLRARGADGSRFESVGAIEKSAIACANFEHLTGVPAIPVDIWTLDAPALAKLCTRRPDVVIMSPPCKGFSGCMPEATARTAKYQKLNALALHSLELVLDAWDEPPALIMLENVPRILTRGKKVLDQAKRKLRKRGYAVDLRTHDCGELGGLGQRRHRVLLVARLQSALPNHLLKPDPKPLRSAGDVVFELPVPTPGSTAGGPMHELPKVSGLNWLRLASIRAGNDWRDIPSAIRIGGPPTQHAGKYGVTDQDRPAHTVIGEARTGKGWADIADPRLAERSARQNGGFGVGDHGEPGHSVLGEGTVRNTFSSVADPRVSPRRSGGYEVSDPDDQAGTVRGRHDVWSAPASVADPRLGCSPRDGTMGVASGESPGSTVLGVASIHRGQGAIVDPRVEPQHRGNYGVEDPDAPASCVRGAHVSRTAPASIADSRGYEPTHVLEAGQPLTSTRDEWVGGSFVLLGPELDTRQGQRGTHAIILAPDWCVHRPMTDLELAALQGLPVWHVPGDPAELRIGAPGGQWLKLRGNKQQRREQIGNAVPPATAQAIAERVLELLDAGVDESFRLSAAGVWVSPTSTRGTPRARPSPATARLRSSWPARSRSRPWPRAQCWARRTSRSWAPWWCRPRRSRSPRHGAGEGTRRGAERRR